MYVSIMKKKDYIEQNLHPKCKGCGKEIDSDICWCGDLISTHTIDCGHSPVPMGCECYYVKLSDNLNIVFEP